MKAIALLLFALAPAGALFAAQQDGSFDQTLSVSGVLDLDLKTNSGGITVRPGPPGIIHIHGILRADHGWFRSSDVEARIQDLERHPPIDQAGGRVRVGYVLGRDTLKNISLDIEIEAPADTRLLARADSGEIHVKGLKGPVDCKSDSGGVDISDIGAEVRAAADSGSIHVNNVAGALRAHADSGGIDAFGIGGSIEAQTDSGSLRLEQTAPGEINARVSSGSINVRLVSGAGYDIRADTESGGITVPPMTVQNAISRQHVEGRVGKGGPLVRLHAESGSVTID